MIRSHGGRASVLGLVPMKKTDKRELWEFMVKHKGGRRGWTQPEELFKTRFRLHGDPDPWLEMRDCC